MVDFKKLTKKPKAKSQEIQTAPPTPNFVTLEGTDDDFPAEIEQAKGEEGGVTIEWEPIKPRECIMGHVRRSVTMSLGGTAYTLDLCPSYADTKPSGTLCLLTKGGKVLQSRMEELSIKDGDIVALMFLGFGEAKEGFNAPRLWKVKKLAR